MTGSSPSWKDPVIFHFYLLECENPDEPIKTQIYEYSQHLESLESQCQTEVPGNFSVGAYGPTYVPT